MHQFPSPHYPSHKEVDAWADEILAGARRRELTVRQLDVDPYDFRMAVRHSDGHYVAFDAPDGETFYGFWQRPVSGRGPVLLHLPGYGAEMSAHPELVADGYHVLHINPRGYATPEGAAVELQCDDGCWPVLPETVRSRGREGYVQWLSDAAAAALWALEQEGVEGDRFACFGTSQGGGTALLLASVLRELGPSCAAADVPFLINFPLLQNRMEKGGAYSMCYDTVERLQREHPEDVAEAWRAIGFVDVLMHAHRLDIPVLLTSGLEDPTCPHDTIESLFQVLPGTRSLTALAGQGHAYTRPFLQLARAWFRTFV